jgi:hypothetical protein
MSDATPKKSAPEVLDVIEDVITQPYVAELGRDLVAKTSWWKKNRTSVTNGIGAVLNLLMLVTVLPNGLIAANTAAYLAFGIQAFVVAVGIFVPDAISERQRASLENYIGRHRKTD